MARKQSRSGMCSHHGCNRQGINLIDGKYYCKAHYRRLTHHQKKAQRAAAKVK